MMLYKYALVKIEGNNLPVIVFEISPRGTFVYNFFSCLVTSGEASKITLFAL